jgi:hypothetical protein
MPNACLSRKAKLVKQEQQAIDAQFEKKRKGAEVAQKMYGAHLPDIWMSY